MSMSTFHTVVEQGGFFEAPRWHEGRWWVSDFYRERVIAVHPDGRTEVIAEVPGQPAGLGWLPDGDLLIVSMKDRRILRRHASGAVSVYVDLSDVAPHPLNDMLVDAAGRAYVGGFGFDLFGGEDLKGADLLRVDPDGSISVAATGLVFPNGAVLTPDDKSLIVGETFAGRYTAFDVADDGELVNRRVWAQLGAAPAWGQVADMEEALEFTPDGCDVDAWGRIWATDIVGERCVLLSDGGTIEEEIPAPEGLSFFACALGGDDGRTLLLAAAPDYLEDRRRANYEGVLLATSVAVPAAWAR